MMDDQTPNFLRKLEEPQECKNAAMWHKHYQIAYWGLFIIGGFLFIFTDKELVGIFLACLGFIVFNLDMIKLEKHARWHLERMKKGDKDEPTR